MKQDINKLIKSYEPLMHKLLHRFKVKRDYEDNLQELRIVVWKAAQLYEKNRGKFKKSTLFFTYVRLSMVSELQNILKVKYRIPPTEKDENGQWKVLNIQELEVQDRIAYYMENPTYYEDLSINAQLTIIADAYSAEDIKAKVDFDFFYSLLTSEEKRLIDLKSQGLNQEEVAKKLKYSQTKVNYKLKDLRNSFKSFISKGGK